MTRRRTRDELANLDWLMDREHASTVPCPICHQPAGQPCTNPITGEEHPAPAHWQRIRAADQEQS